MTATLAEIMDALADQIRDAMDAVDIGQDISVQVEPRMIMNPTLPSVDMYPGDPSSEPELRAFTQLVGGELLTVRARVAIADHEAGQDLLLALMDDEDPLSILQAIQDDPTLNGLASDLDVRGRSGMTPFFDVPAPIDVTLLGCTWDVVVIKARS